MLIMLQIYVVCAYYPKNVLLLYANYSIKAVLKNIKVKEAKLLLLVLSLMCVTLSGCVRKEAPRKTPWGTVVNDGESTGEPQGGGTSSPDITTLSQIVSNGEMIVLTITGPDTYYDYHGHGLGVQYMMCEDFARKIGVTLRVELCKDTLELYDKLRRGYGDVIAVQLPKDKGGRPGMRGKEVRQPVLRYCGASDKKRQTQWAVAQGNTELADSLDSWFRDDMPQRTLEREDYLLALAVTHSASYNVNSAQFRVQRSSYNALIQRYAPLAGLPWQLISAQCSQESGFDPGARSWAGACGLMQLMPATAARFGLHGEEVFDPEKNIAAGCRLMGMLMKEFSDVPSHHERIGFALASYNAGSGHIRDAMALARRDGLTPYSWQVVSQYVLHLSDPAYYQDPVVRHGFMRGQETYNYVRSIRSRAGI